MADFEAAGFYYQDIQRGQYGDLDTIAIDQMRYDYYRSALPLTDPVDVNQFVEETSVRHWAKPNAAVGSDYAQEGQRFARQTLTLAKQQHVGDAIDYGGLVRTADNASSGRSSAVAQSLEIAAKLYLPVSLAKAHRPRVIRELVGESEGVVLDLLDCAVNTRRDDQPLVAYVFTGEEMVMDLLRGHGFKKTMFAARAKSLPGVYQVQFQFQD